MKKLLTLLIMSFLVLSVYAQSRAVEDNTLRDKLTVKKSTLNIQSDETVPFCHEGLEIPRTCEDCGLFGNWEYIWFDDFGTWECLSGAQPLGPGDGMYYDEDGWFLTADYYYLPIPAVDFGFDEVYYDTHNWFATGYFAGADDYITDNDEWGAGTYTGLGYPEGPDDYRFSNNQFYQGFLGMDGFNPVAWYSFINYADGGANTFHQFAAQGLFGENNWIQDPFGPLPVGGGSFLFGLNDQFLKHIGNYDEVGHKAFGFINDRWDPAANGAVTHFDYDWVIRQVLDTTTFFAYPWDHHDVYGQSDYSWWMGSNDPLYQLPGYGKNWYMALVTDSLFRIQPQLESAVLEFDARWALEACVDWIYLEARSWGSSEIPNVYKNDLTHWPVSDWFPIAQYWFNDRPDGGNPASDFNSWLAGNEDPGRTFDQVKQRIYIDGSVWGGLEQPEMDDGYTRNLRGEIVEFRFVFGSNSTIDNSDGELTKFGAFNIDNVILWRGEAPELICDAGDTKLGFHREQVASSSYHTGINAPFVKYGTENLYKDYVAPAGTYVNCGGNFGTMELEEWGRNPWHNSTMDAYSGRSLSPNYLHLWNDHYDPAGTVNYLFPHPWQDGFSGPEADWSESLLYPNGNPYVYPRGNYDRQVYANIRSMPINLRMDVEGNGVHDWHTICLDFKFKMNLEYNDCAPAADNEDVGGSSDWWRVYVWDPQLEEVIYDSRIIRDDGVYPVCDGVVQNYNTDFIDFSAWVGSDINLDYIDDSYYGPNGYLDTDYYVYVNFEFYSNPNPYKGDGLYIDNVEVVHKWDNSEQGTASGNESFATAFNLEEVPANPCDAEGYGWQPIYDNQVGSGSEQFVTTCAMILPELGGLYYDPTNANGQFGRDEDFYKLWLDEEQFCDIVVDNQEIDLQVQIYGHDVNGDIRLIVTDDGSASNGMPYSSDYDRVIFTVDPHLPNMQAGWYYIVILPSDNVSLEQLGRYTLSVNRGWPWTDMIAVTDVPQDQGLQVRLTWDPSFLDTECIPIWCCNNDDGNPLQLNGIRVEKYSIWRIAGFAQNWDYVGEVIAAPDPLGLMSYAYVAPTVVNTIVHRFRLGTHHFNGEMYFGAEASGSSQDNLAPSIRMDRLEWLSQGVEVDWSIEGFDDVVRYELFRNTVPCDPDTETPLTEVSGSTFSYVDGSADPSVGEYYYLVRGYDASGNKGDTYCLNVTGVGSEVGVPVDYSLQQNYPNPFNPSTTIKFGLPTEADVTVKVFDILGQEVAQILNKNLKAGYHSVNFDASKLMSGMYIYRIQAKGFDGSDFTDVKKMLLVK
jgi:hypothetical protein